MALSAGHRLGPYEILEPIGAGGMGEVYRARDPRLSREVAIKLITTQGAPSPDRLQRFETEARAAAQLAHPNVVTVHDVGTHDGQPYLVLELLEGETLRETLRGGIPPLREAVVWAREVSRGLAAAHERGIVHRDLKPENIFLTRDGRVKILDFGLAKLHEPLVSSDADSESPTATKGTSPGVLLGTVGYMSPEQVKGETPDPRTDVFALGVVLFEVVTGKRAFGGDTAPEVLAAILRDEPPALASIQPGISASLEAVVRRCLAKRPTDRFSSGAAAEAALEMVLATLEPSRAIGVKAPEPRGPYPGLSSFTEADAERFFGREAEVEALWEKLRRTRLLAVIGPSGAGKTSFVRAGLVPARPSGWGAIVATPGGAPMRSLAQALVGELPSDADTTRQLLAFDDPEVAFAMVGRWRSSHLEALLVVDQFEELFTLNPAEEQERFVNLLGRLVREGDVHVLLSMRDDFLIRCHEHKPLQSIFQNLTPILALGGDDLRRALTEPAKREGFAFEDDSLVAEMLESVADARGALPLLAFAVSRLWEKRDREKKLLTRKAYEEIGGVAGALAQHAEQTLERIGLEREPIVRELFRNLVTSQWTRAVADREQLLSVLPDREAGAQVLDQLIDARLLTSSRHPERAGDEDRAKDLADDRPREPSVRTAGRHRIEIIHESLLRAWPRLVRWQAQDEEGAVLRDQLRQAAHLWEEKGRPDDLLWTGTSEREFELWQDRYPGKLTALEDAFAQSMVHRARRRKRVRRTLVASTIVVLLAVLTIIGSLWRRSVTEAQRADAAGLFSLAQHRLEEHPTEALAYAIASLERADDAPIRRLALEALWRGPTEIRLPVPHASGIDVSPDGRWLVSRLSAGRGLFEGGGALWPSDGGPPVPLEGADGVMESRFSPAGDLVAAHTDSERRTVGLWSVPEGRLLRTFDLGDQGQAPLFRISPDSQRLLTCLQWPLGERSGMECRAWPVGGGEPVLLARIEAPLESWPVTPAVDLAWSQLAWADGSTARLAPIEEGRVNRAAVRSIEHGGTVTHVLLDDDGQKLLTASEEGRSIRIWSLQGDSPRVVRTLTGPERTDFRFDASGSILASNTLLWDLAAPADVEPLRVQGRSWALAVEPEGRWLATNVVGRQVSLWPLTRRYPRVLSGHTKRVYRPAFTPDGRRLVSTSLDGSVRVWPLDGNSRERSRLLHQTDGAFQAFTKLAVAPDGSFVAAGNSAGRVVVLPLDGGPPRELSGFTEMIQAVAVSPDARLVAAGAGVLAEEEALVRVWDLTTREVRILDAGDGQGIRWPLRFNPKGELWVASGKKLRRWDLAGAAPRILDEIDLSRPESHASGIEDLAWDGSKVLLHDVSAGEAPTPSVRLLIQDLKAHVTRALAWVYEGSGCYAVFDPTGRLVVSRNSRGIVGVTSARGGEPHLLLSHEGIGEATAVSPDGQWIATGGEDGTIRLWPMPDLSQPPLHTLPREELLAKLKSLTNLRAVRDPKSPTGWTIEAGPFPGWEEIPTW